MTTENVPVGFHLRHRDNLINGLDWAPQLHEELTTLSEKIARTHEEGLETREDAVKVAFSLALGEAQDLLFEVAHGRSRPALRSARALFELALLTNEIREDQDRGRAFLSRQFQVAQTAAVAFRRLQALSADLEMPPPIPESFNSAPQTDGHAARSSRATTIREQARRCGLEEDYRTFFAIASAVTHPAAFSAVGGLAVHGSWAVSELGSSAQGMAYALDRGCEYLRLAMDQMPVGPRGQDLRHHLAEREALLAAALVAEDRLQIWSKAHAWHMTSNLVGVCMVDELAQQGKPNGFGEQVGVLLREQWFAVDMLDHTYCQIDPPARLSRDVQRRIGRARHDVAAKCPGPRPRVVAYLDPGGATPVPCAGAGGRWRPMTEAPFDEQIQHMEPMLAEARSRLERMLQDPGSHFRGFQFVAPPSPPTTPPASVD